MLLSTFLLCFFVPSETTRSKRARVGLLVNMIFGVELWCHWSTILEIKRTLNPTSLENSEMTGRLATILWIGFCKVYKSHKTKQNFNIAQ